MATRPSGRMGRKKLGAEQSSDGGSVISPRLPILPCDEERRDWHSNLRSEGLNDAILALLPSDEGSSPEREGRKDSQRGDVGDSGGLCPSGQWSGGDNTGLPARSLSGVEIVERAEFPDVSDGHRESFEEAITLITGNGLRHKDDVLESGEVNLDNLIAKAARTLNEVMDINLPSPYDEHYARVLSAKKDAAVAVMNIGLKADENKFRKRETDVISKLYDKIKLERGSLEVVIN